MPKTPSTPHQVALCAYDGLCTFEFGLCVEVFGLPRPEFEAWYALKTVAVEPGPLTAMGGIIATAAHGLEALEDADTILIPGWRAVDAPPPEAWLAALRRAHNRGARLVSICSGAFVLAAAGLLDGRTATTHWRYAHALKVRYPAVTVDADVLYIDDGQILTSAGSAAGLDLCLHIVRRDFGAAIAGQVARRLVIQPHRDGGQAQFVERPMPQSTNRMAPLLDWARARLSSEIRVGNLARQAGMSLRTFERRFAEATGTSPARWLVQERLAFARDLLEASDIAVEDIATRCGFGSAATLRHHFRAQLRVSPLQYRNNFRTT